MSDFGRRTWNRDEFAELAKQGQSTHEQSLKSSLTDLQLQQLKKKYTNYHDLMKSSLRGLNQKVLATGISSYKKGKQFGFYCELCNLTLKDNMQYVDHLNHKLHQIKFETIFDEPLIIDTRDNDEIGVEEFKTGYIDLVKQFVREHQVKEKKVSKPKRSRRREISKGDSSGSNDLAETMGFATFGGSRK